MAIKLISVLISCYLLMAGLVSGFTPVTYSPQSTTECGQSDPLQDDQQLMEALRMIHQELGPPGCNPPQNRSCQDIFYCFPSAPSGYHVIHPSNGSPVQFYCDREGIKCNPPQNSSCQEIIFCFPSAPSGYHEIRVPNGSLVQVYCDMEGTNCGGQGGWMRIANVNMSQSGASCPQGLTQKSPMSGLTLCGQSGAGCRGTFFSALGFNYSKVCGQLRGYQYGSPDAFGPYSTDSSLKVNEFYVEGVSITYGAADATKHIWTYATGLSLEYENHRYVCPCSAGSTAVVPPYVGSDYYCETAYHDTGFRDNFFFPDDVLWDGQQCASEEAPCCTHPNMPWFIKSLNETTTEDIQLRMCISNTREETLLEVIEFYVQ